MRLLLSFAFVPVFLFPLDVHEAATPPAKAHGPSAPPATPPTRGAEVVEAPPDSGPCPAPSGAARRSRSIGTPTHGQLSHGKFVGESELIHHVDADGCHFWGTDELVGTIEAVAASVAEEHPGHRLTVGELSKREGGDIVGHASHENGRDVDFGFYFVDEAGDPYEPDHLVDVRRDGTARVNGRVLTFDVARNWRAVETLLTSDDADVNFILVGWRIRQRLLAHARSIGVERELYDRASRVLIRPRRGRHPHRNHFHVRIYCPEAHAGCRDRGRLWDWVAEARARRAESSEAEEHAAGPATEAQSSEARTASSASSTAPSRS